MDSPSQCRALNVSDEKRCLELATSVNGLFCTFHSKQCQGLYRGYKLRNAKLDSLAQNPPKYLAESKIQPTNQTFQDVSTHETLKEIHDHLFLKYQLLERVIRARKLHHSRFFSQSMDYGHAKFLDSLQGQRNATLKALERLEKRTTELLYKKQKWFTWVRECQDEEDTTRDKEQKKVKAEAAMFRRHWKATQLRQRDLRAKENKLRQDAYLEQVYKERMAERERNGEGIGTDEDEMEWDPIEDVLEDSRGSYMDLIRTFLWLAVPESISDHTDQESNENPVQGSASISKAPASIDSLKDTASILAVGTVISTSKSKKKKKKKASNTTSNEESKSTSPAAEPDKSLIETRQEMYERLKNGESFDRGCAAGVMVGGTIENPIITTKSIPLPEDEIVHLQDEIFQIKHLLFCRLLLGHAALLPAALRANSVEEFLGDEEVTTTALRDLCLKMENPSLQVIRDACADLFRSEEENEEDTELAQEDPTDKKKLDGRDMQVFQKRKTDLPDKWVPKRDKGKKIAEEGMPSLDAMLGDDGMGKAVEFGRMEASSLSRPRKIKVKICGRTIWNYPSNKAMSRGGWLHFCIITKDYGLNDAIALCRHWDEFFELNILSIWGYFPGSKFNLWSENRWRQQLLQLGFIVYFETALHDAESMSIKRQQGGRHGRRSHAVFEARNFMCAHIKRDDQASRRLVQYLSMQSYRVLVLVRDAETGNLLIKPPEEERWLLRGKSGLGRAAKNEWNVMKSIGPEFFEEMEKLRSWNFSFKEYYDVYVWDLEAGEPFPSLYNTILEMLSKALRCRGPADLYVLAGPVLSTLYKDEVTNRVRDILPGEKVQSIYDHYRSPDAKFRYGKVEDAWGKNISGLVRAKAVFDEDNKYPRNYFYSEIDELEDTILFPEESEARRLHPSEIGKIEPLKQWEDSLTIRKFVDGRFIEDSENEDDSDYDTEMDDYGDMDDEEDEDDDDYDDGEAEGNHESTPEDLGHLWQDMSWSTDLKDAMTKLSIKTLKIPRNKPSLRTSHKEMEEDFMVFLDREKAKIFKQIWHKADLSPHAQDRYEEMKKMTKGCYKYNRQVFDCPPVILALNLQFELQITEYEIDLRMAIGKLTPFFHGNFLASEDGAIYKDSLLFKQEQRAEAPRNHRSHHSNKTRPDEFFKEFESVWDRSSNVVMDKDDIINKWDRAIRPIVAHLYKCGVIRTRADSFFMAQGMAGKEPGLDHYDFYQEQRANMEPFRMLKPMKNPHDVPSFKSFARSFTNKHPNARFAVLSLWSAPHFYPLMIGRGNGYDVSFRDLTDRIYDWKFVPKDMPNSEWSIHFAASQRIEPYKKYLGDRVVVKREKFLVMGRDEKDLFRLAAVTAFAIQTRPWRWEVDLWKSFINVDLKFVEELDERWIE